MNALISGVVVKAKVIVSPSSSFSKPKLMVFYASAATSIVVEFCTCVKYGALFLLVELTVSVNMATLILSLLIVPVTLISYTPTALSRLVYQVKALRLNLMKEVY